MAIGSWIRKLKETLPYYQGVMDKLPYQSQIHGLAALQWSVCQDSLSRPNERKWYFSPIQTGKSARELANLFQFPGPTG